MFYYFIHSTNTTLDDFTIFYFPHTHHNNLQPLSNLSALLTSYASSLAQPEKIL